MLANHDDGPLTMASLNHPLGPGFGRTLGYMRFMGRALLVYGGLCCLTLVGAAAGVPMIMTARRFLKGVDDFDVYRRETDLKALKAGFEEMGRSFRLMKILTLITVAVGFLYLMVLVMVGGMGLMSGLNNLSALSGQ